MLIIKAIVEAKNGFEKELEQECRTMVAMTQNESGVSTYVLHRATDNPRKFFFFERYVNQDAIDAHCSTEHLQNFLKRLEHLTACPPDIEIYEELASIIR